MFDGVFDIHDRRIVGEKHLKLKLAPPGSATPVDAIAFNAADFAPATRVRAAYRLDVNEWQGVRRAQLVIEHLFPE